MIEITANAQAIKELAKTLENNAKLLKRDINTALNATARHLKGQWAKELGKEVALPQRVIKQTIRQELARTGGDASAAVVQKKSKRLPLKEFKPRQIAAGVSYIVYKKVKRRTLAGAFMGPKPGLKAIKLHGHVWSRQGAKRVMTKGRYAGKMRQPIVKRFGPSPFDTSRKHETPVRLVHLGKARLLEELKERIRVGTLRASGAI
jgi:hypothetical protein